MHARATSSPTPLSQFQDAFSRALFDPECAGDYPPDVAALARQPAFAVYRNTVMKGCIDALQANYPCVSRLVGDEWFRSVAALYVRAHPPTRTTMVDYGEHFAQFLAQFEPTQQLPYLPGVAQLDRFWTEAHIARDEDGLDFDELAVSSIDSLMSQALRPVASARWAWFALQPVFTIWQRNRATGPIDDSAIDWQGEGALLMRRDGVVRWFGLDAAQHALVDACARGCVLSDAAAAALEVDPQVDPSHVMGPLLAAGVFAPIDVLRASHSAQR